MRSLYIIILMLISTSLFACKDNEKKLVQQSISKGDTMKIRIIVGDSIFTAILYNNPTSKDFVSLLPLSLTLTDYSNTEKISDLPRKLSIKDAPAGYKPAPGDLTVYAPWGNLALFYKEFPYSNGLVVLGKLDGGVEVFNKPGYVKVRIELDNEEANQETK